MRENGFPGRQTAAPAYGQVSVLDGNLATRSDIAAAKAGLMMWIRFPAVIVQGVFFALPVKFL